MKNRTILLAAGAFGVAALFTMWSRKTGPFGGDAERMAGVSTLYGMSAGQQAATAAAVQSEWKKLDSVFATQPDFYV